MYSALSPFYLKMKHNNYNTTINFHRVIVYFALITLLQIP